MSEAKIPRLDCSDEEGSRCGSSTSSSGPNQTLPNTEDVNQASKGPSPDQKAGFHNLPDIPVLLVASYLDVLDLFSFSKVCKNVHDICESSSTIWIRAFKRCDHTMFEEIASCMPDEKVLLFVKTYGVKKLLKDYQKPVSVRIGTGFLTFSTYCEPLLHIACSYGHLKVVKCLVKKGKADVNIVYNCQTIEDAISRRHNDVVKYLIEECGVDLGLRDEDDETLLQKALHTAAVHENLDIVKYLVEECNADVHARNEKDQTPLHLASITGDLNIVKYLVEKGGAEINLKNAYGQTAFLISCLSSDIGLEVVKYLAEKCDPDVNEKDDKQQTALDLAHCRGGIFMDCLESDEIIEYLLVESKMDLSLKKKFGDDRVHELSENGKLDTLKCLVKVCNTNVNRRNDYGNTPLHQASAAGQLDVVKWLIKECGGEICCTNLKGETPLHIASKKSQLAVVKWLVKECQADINAKDINKNVPIHLASQKSCSINENQRVDLVKWMIQEGGASVNSENEEGRTPLHFAAAMGNLDVVKCLVEIGGASVNLKNQDGNTPLHLVFMDDEWRNKNACWTICRTKSKILDLAKWLVQHGGADANLKNNNGEKPIDFY